MDPDSRLVVAMKEGEVEEGRVRSLGVADANYYNRMDEQQALLYSTGNHVQYLVINRNAKDYEKGYIYKHTHTRYIYIHTLHIYTHSTHIYTHSTYIHTYYICTYIYKTESLCFTAEIKLEKSLKQATLGVIFLLS